MSEENNMQAVIDAVRAGMQPYQDQNFPGIMLVGTSNGYKVTDLRKYMAFPTRRSGTTTVFDAASFVAFMNDMGATQEHSAIFVDKNPQRPAVVGIIDYDATNGGADWRQHRVEIGFRNTPEWDVFMENNGKLMDAMQFANFCEDYASQFISPDYSTMMKIVQNFEVRSDNQFSQATRLDSGSVQLTYKEDPQGKVAGGQIEVPQKFELSLKPFQGASPYTIEAMFRWRLRGGNLGFGFKLLRVDDIIRDAITDVVAKIEQGSNISVFEGIAPAPTADTMS